MRRFLSQMTPQQMSQLVLAALIILTCVYVLSPFFAPIGWAVVLAIATWPLYQRFQNRLPPNMRRDIAPLLFTFAITLVFHRAVLGGGAEMGRGAQQLVIWLRDSDHGGVVVPDYLDKI